MKAMVIYHVCLLSRTIIQSIKEVETKVYDRNANVSPFFVSDYENNVYLFLFNKAGFIGPILIGRLLDNACDLWDYPCGKRGGCLGYNKAHVARNLTILLFSFSFISFVFSAFAWKYYKPVVIMEGCDGRRG